MTAPAAHTPKWFYAVCALALLWSLMGVGAYIAQGVFRSSGIRLIGKRPKLMDLSKLRAVAREIA
jgi:hypothetical protein